MSTLTAADDKTSILMRRIGAMLMDTLLVAVLILVVNRLVPAVVHQQLPMAGAAIAAVLALSYFEFPEAFWGATAGKAIMKIRVIDAAGQPPGLWKSGIRTLLRLVEVNPLLFGGLPAYLFFRFSRRGQRLGDLLANTFVVRPGDAEAIRGGTFNVDSLTPAS